MTLQNIGQLNSFVLGYPVPMEFSIVRFLAYATEFQIMSFIALIQTCFSHLTIKAYDLVY